MIHKTLHSYQASMSHDETQEHPDGELWLISDEEWDDLPYGIIIEEAATGVQLRYSEFTGRTHLKYGIRGYRE